MYAIFLKLNLAVAGLQCQCRIAEGKREDEKSSISDTITNTPPPPRPTTTTSRITISSGRAPGVAPDESLAIGNKNSPLRPYAGVVVVRSAEGKHLYFVLRVPFAFVADIRSWFFRVVKSFPYIDEMYFCFTDEMYFCSQYS